MKKNRIIFGLLFALFFSVVFSLLFKLGQKGNPFRSETILKITVIFFNALILGSIAFRISKKFSNKTTIEFRKSILPTFFLFVASALIISLLLVSGSVYTFYLIKGLDTSNFFSNLFEVELPVAIKQITIWILIGSAIFFYLIWRKAIEREQKLREENLKYRYRTFKSQVNPHFLFNSLNTLSELIYSDVKKADNYLQKLSGIYRYVLENEENDLVPLEKEIVFIKEYFNLQKERDNDKISLQIEIGDTNGYFIIPVSLQLLLENAFKHNSMSHEKPLKIKITSKGDYIVVSNNIQRKNTLESSTQKGLQNLSERVKLILGKDLIVSVVNDEFNVELPIIYKTV
jgi:two-component system, LytTR family, sensor kinase